MIGVACTVLLIAAFLIWFWLGSRGSSGEKDGAAMSVRVCRRGCSGFLPVTPYFPLCVRAATLDEAAVADRIGRWLPWEYDYRYDEAVNRKHGIPGPAHWNA